MSWSSQSERDGALDFVMSDEDLSLRRGGADGQAGFL